MLRAAHHRAGIGKAVFGGDRQRVETEQVDAAPADLHPHGEGDRGDGPRDGESSVRVSNRSHRAARIIRAIHQAPAPSSTTAASRRCAAADAS